MWRVERDVNRICKGVVYVRSCGQRIQSSENRLVSTAKAYRDGNGALQTGGSFVTAAYDGPGRRISKAVNTAGT